MGIRKRLVGSYFGVICLTVLILEIFLILFVNYYYFHNVERILMNQAELSASFFQQYFAGEDLEKQSGRLLQGFASQSEAEVQILDSSGRLLRDSTGYRADKSMAEYADVQSAITGRPDTWKGNDPITREPILAVSFPLKAHDKTIGVVRFVTSLTETIKTVRQIAVLLVGVGLLVLAIVTLLSLLLSWTITRSIKDLKQAADRMTEGDFSIRVHKRYRDELGSLADTLNMMAGRIAQSEQLKNEFISSVSHELRTPLTSIKGWVVTLKANGAGDGRLFQDGLGIIDSESDRLARMVDELLDFSKLDSGRINVRFEAVNLPELLRHIERQLAPRAARQGVTLEVLADENMPEIQADENRLKQVLINLVDNALKFTEHPGRITLQVYSNSGYAVLAVEDTGSGISEENLKNVVQKFYKVDPHAPGSGLGLAISEQIIKLHRGKLHIFSRPGQGTKVEICLPIENDRNLTI
ncbi:MULTISPECIES: HAMP domain-containing sensor histidine kinase [Paenibacillus]|uniref:histidine kinase n=1 Tax=Paenibacillus albilobatus TaxID=2716884 RepID=A0A920C8U6_9BACL|nr:MULTISPECIES: HAMP domain-containing sensor histidine kinase [Paenibacillus]GIO29113.1 sensor histidine kinase [Paenibacillus albilobatus]